MSFCTLDHNFQSSCCIGSQLFRLVPPHQKLKIIEINFKADAWLQCNNKRYWWQCIEMFKVKTGKSALPSLCDSVTRHHKHIRYKCHLRSVKNDSFQNFRIEDEKIWEGLNSDFWARISKMKKNTLFARFSLKLKINYFRWMKHYRDRNKSSKFNLVLVHHLKWNTPMVFSLFIISLYGQRFHFRKLKIQHYQVTFSPDRKSISYIWNA